MADEKHEEKREHAILVTRPDGTVEAATSIRYGSDETAQVALDSAVGLGENGWRRAGDGSPADENGDPLSVGVVPQ